MSQGNVASYLKSLWEIASSVEVTDQYGKHLDLDDTISELIMTVRNTHNAGNKILFVGNGGSAAIASHMAIDYSKNGRLRSMALNDAAALTCLSNDLGYERVFSKQIEMLGNQHDVLFAISSSGMSKNILQAADVAKEKKLHLVTFSGFSADNRLRNLGGLNFYIPSNEYGFVEISHLTLCHAILDFKMGWQNV